MSYKCNEDALSLPIVGCDDCSSFEARIKQLEELMEGAVQAISELQETVEDLQDQIDTKQDELTAGDGITIENNVISAVSPTQIHFTIIPTLVCDAIVCDSVVCSSITVDASAETIVNDIQNNHAQNITLTVNGVTYTPSSFAVENQLTHLYRITFNVTDLANNVTGQYVVTGYDDNVEFTYYE